MVQKSCTNWLVAYPIICRVKKNPRWFARFLPGPSFNRGLFATRKIKIRCTCQLSRWKGTPYRWHHHCWVSIRSFSGECSVSRHLEDRNRPTFLAGLAAVTSRGGQNGRFEVGSPLANRYGIWWLLGLDSLWWGERSWIISPTRWFVVTQGSLGFHEEGLMFDFFFFSKVNSARHMSSIKSCTVDGRNPKQPTGMYKDLWIMG